MGKNHKEIKESQLSGFKYFKIVDKMLHRLHNAGCERDKAGNRKLHMDQYASLILLYMFNPICDSLRAIHRISELKKVQKRFCAARASLSSLSEASTVVPKGRFFPVEDKNKNRAISEITRFL